MKVGFGVLFVVLGLWVSSARADIGLVLNASTAPSPFAVSAFTNSGHAAIYLSRICPASPVRLRLCEPGEQGSVLSTYDDLGEAEPYEWNVISLSAFLYGVDDSEHAPLIAIANLRHTLQEHQRETRLAAVCGEGQCGGSPAHWRDEIGAAFVREVYMFQVRTTKEQDEALIEEFNDRANVNRYNFFRNNCASFARIVINRYFPGAARPDYLNDFSITSPKAIARSFTHYAVKHPELQFHVTRYAQVPGEYKHSGDARDGTEVLFREKRWALPIYLLGSHELAFFAVSYTLTGRFNPYHELERRPSAEANNLLQQIKSAERSRDQALEAKLRNELQQERKAALGTPQDWKSYRNRFQELLGTAIAEGIVNNQGDLQGFLRDLEKSKTYVDDQGAPWAELRDEAGVHQLGLAKSNVLSAGSDRKLAVRLLLAHMEAVLREKKKYREPWEVAQQDSQLAAGIVHAREEQLAVAPDKPAQEASKSGSNEPGLQISTWSATLR
jgi:hypothetical protein